VYGEYFALPGDEEADYLLAGLAKLIRQRGVETFVSAPLLLRRAATYVPVSSPSCWARS